MLKTSSSSINTTAIGSTIVTLANSDFGKIAVFNNRVPGNNDQAFSSVHLLNPSYTDYDNNFATETGTGTYLPSDFDWSYTAPDSIYSSGLSSFNAWKTATV